MAFVVISTISVEKERKGRLLSRFLVGLIMPFSMALLLALKATLLEVPVFLPRMDRLLVFLSRCMRHLILVYHRVSLTILIRPLLRLLLPFTLLRSLFFRRLLSSESPEVTRGAVGRLLATRNVPEERWVLGCVVLGVCRCGPPLGPHLQERGSQ